jgi:hypothetical protein
VANLRAQPQFENETAILMMDSALPHVSERVLRLLGQNKIMALFARLIPQISSKLWILFYFLLSRS